MRAPPEPPSPEVLSHLSAKMQRWLSRMGPFEMRPVYPRDELKPSKRPPYQQVWFRLSGPIGDDVNLHRFLGLIAEFRQEAQLLIVSHQKRTMEAGDCLLGVTMQPGGSSKVVTERVSSTA